MRNLISFQIKYPLRNLSRNRKRGILTTSAFIGAIVISFALLQTNSSISGTFAGYFDDQINWDIKTEFHGFQDDTIIDLMIEDYAELSNIEPLFEMGVEPVNNPELSVKIRGLEPNSELIEIDLQKGRWFSNDTALEGIMSSYIAEPLEIEVGDSFEFWFLNQLVEINIVGICRDLDAHISCYMNLPALEQILGFTPINSALLEVRNLTDDELNNLILNLNREPTIQFAIEKSTYEEQMQQMVSSQTMIVTVMIALGLIISFLTIFVTGYISIIERDREIALLRVFGFNKKQIVGHIIIELGVLSMFAVGFGFLIGGEGLGRLLITIISEMFFELEVYRNIGDYLLVFGFSAICIGVSLYPGISLIRKQKLATSIQE